MGYRHSSGMVGLAALAAALVVGTSSEVLAQTGKEGAVAALENRMATLARMADDAEAERQRWNERCAGSRLGGRGYCISHRDTAAHLEQRVRSAVVAEQEAARRQGIYPGTFRALKRKYELDRF